MCCLSLPSLRGKSPSTRMRRLKLRQALTGSAGTNQIARFTYMRVVAWGTYDLGKPRVRILLRGLRENGVDVVECHADLWRGVEDKSQIRGLRNKLTFALRWVMAYPSLIYRYLRQPAHDAILVGYMGQFDVLVLWPFATLRGKPMIWDAFLSLYNTVVEDRCLVSKWNPIAYCLYVWEWLACRAADAVLLDTATHARYFADTFRVRKQKLHRVFVGAEPERFHPSEELLTKPRATSTYRVLFYGQFIPLHGVETVVRAAIRSDKDNVRWQLIGTGQEAPQIRRMLDALRPTNLDWTDWVPYDRLVSHIHAADVCLGIFGATDKAARVIPNKVYQVIASGKPLITGDTPAAREVLQPGPGVILIPVADPEALRRAVMDMRARFTSIDATSLASLRERITPSAVVLPLKELLARITCG